MRSFNLKEYLKNPNRKVITRAGKDVRIVCIDKTLDDHPIVALLQGPVCENTCFYRRNECELYGKRFCEKKEE